MKKIKKILLSIFLPVVMILTAGILSFASITEIAHALSGNGGGLFVGSNTTLNFNATISGSSATNGGGVYVSNGGTFNMNGGSISGNTATDGGGVYVANGGTFNMFGGSISGNKATNNGDSIYNNGTFIMTGGTLGETNGVAWVYCDRNAVTQIYGGTVHDNFYMYSNLQTKMGTTINGKIFLAETSTITVQDYAGETPEYNIEVSSSRQSGTIVTFKGSTVEPILSKINVTGYDSESYAVKTKKDSSGNWTISLVENSYDFPTTWKTEVASSTHMTTTVTPANLTSIKFVASVPSGYTQIGTLSTGLPVYQGTTATEIAFVGKNIKAPYNSKELFKNLGALTSINFSAFDTSNVTNMYCMFYGCNNLTSLNVSNFDTSKVTRMDQMFSGLNTLTSLDVSNFDTSKVTDMGSMFNSCLKLKSLDVSNFNTSKVTNMGGMFSGLNALTSLNVSGFNTTNVTNMKYMFSQCRRLTSLNLSNFNTSKVTDMGYMFQSCNALTSLDVSNFDTSNVTDMYAMFQSCNALTNIDVSNFNTSNVTNMKYMFLQCSGLTSLNLSSFDMTNVATYDNMLNFGSTGKLKALKTPYNNTSALSITTGSTLYNVETGAVVTSVPANTTASKTYATRLTLTFDANGGTCNTTSAAAYYNVSLHDSGFVFPYPTKSGYMFSGWYQNTSFVGTKLSLDSVFTTNCKFYAKWEEQNQPSGGGSSNSPCYIGWEETGRPLVNEVSEDIKRYNNNYTLESIDGFVIISEYNSSSFQDYTLVERLNISHLPVQIYIVELNPEGPNASYINCSNCSLIVAIYVQEYAFGISNTWDGVIFDENEQLFRELAPNAIFWDLRGFCTENFKPEYNENGELTTEQYKLILGRQVQLCILPENFYLGIDWSLSEAGCVVQNYLFEDVTGDYSFVSSKNNDQNEIYRDLAKFSLNFNQERTIQNILNLNDEKLLETKRKIKLVSNVKKE